MVSRRFPTRHPARRPSAFGDALLRFRPVATALCLVAAVAVSVLQPARASDGASPPLDPFDAVIGLRALVPGDAVTAGSLGTERRGSGVVIDAGEGLVLTIGYLVMEAGSVELLLPDGRVVSGTVAAYDYDTGFGLVRADRPLDIPQMPLGASQTEAQEAAEVLVVSSDGRDRTIGPALVVSRRDFAGYWEYLMPDAIFTAPPHPGYGGAALVSRRGELLGIGSLHVGAAGSLGGRTVPGNMFVPVEALDPIFDDLLAKGRADAPPRPWLGLHTMEVGGLVMVRRVSPGGPAERAGVEPRDVIVAVGDDPVVGQADFYRKVWAMGDAGVEVPLALMRAQGRHLARVRSADRYDFLKLDGSF